MSVVKTEMTELTPSPHLLDHGYEMTPENQIASAVPHHAPAVKRKLNLETQQLVVPIKQEFKTPQPRQRQRRATPTKKNTRYDEKVYRCFLFYIQNEGFHYREM